jgi:hypothetical protein
VKDLPGLMQGKAEPDTCKEAFLAYAAYFGTYTVDLVKGMVVHHVEAPIGRGRQSAGLYRNG